MEILGVDTMDRYVRNLILDRHACERAREPLQPVSVGEALGDARNPFWIDVNAVALLERCCEIFERGFLVVESSPIAGDGHKIHQPTLKEDGSRKARYAAGLRFRAEPCQLIH